MKSAKNWLKALFSRTALSVWWVLSALSTLTTFYIKSFAGRPRLVSAISAALGFAWANYSVFKGQQDQIVRLNEEAQRIQTRKSELTIHPDGGSQYILSPANKAAHGDFKGGYFEFHLMIENTGQKNSLVDKYKIEIMELRIAVDNLRPEEGRNGAQGRHAVVGLHPNQILSRTRVVRIDPESASDHGMLLFFVPDVTLEQFVGAGLGMHGEEHRFGTLHCRLTITDMSGSSAAAEFELSEV
jgi:hypothetical protein